MAMSCSCRLAEVIDPGLMGDADEWAHALCEAVVNDEALSRQRARHVLEVMESLLAWFRGLPDYPSKDRWRPMVCSVASKLETVYWGLLEGELPRVYETLVSKVTVPREWLTSRRKEPVV